MGVELLIACDHGGYETKERIVAYCKEQGIPAKDLGTHSAEESVDYPDIADLVAAPISNGEYERGVLVCGTGIGMSMRANRYNGMRAALVYDEESAARSRDHNNSNVICLGNRTLGPEEALELFKIWFSTEGPVKERHNKRVEMLDGAIE